MSEKIRVGKILRGFGIKGEVKVQIITDEPEKRFKVKKVLYLKQDETFSPVTITTVRYHQSNVLLSFADHPDLTSVEGYHGCELFIDRKDIKSKDSVYAFELMNVSVYKEDGSLVGVVSDILDTGAHIVLRIKTDAKDVLIPYVDRFIVRFDQTKNILVIRWMEGL
jgi:16S rRNA processing protein RimM